jgi:hypothetical protein
VLLAADQISVLLIDLQWFDPGPSTSPLKDSDRQVEARAKLNSFGV